MLFLFSVTFIHFFGFSSSLEKEKCINIHREWIQEAFFLTQNTVGFTAPVSGRAYAYFSIGMYESTVEFFDELNSLSDQLNEYNRQVWMQNDKELNWSLVANSVDFEMLSYLFRNMPPSNNERVHQLFSKLNKANSKFCSKKKNQASIFYGKRIAQEIIEWSKLDRGDEGFNQNYPENFVAPVCEGCWTKTVPGYLPSLLPYWGNNRPLIKKSDQVAANCIAFEYSPDTNSVMYKEAMKVLVNSKSPNQKHEIIAEYWDDAAGYSGTPTGHFFTIAKKLAIEQHISPTHELQLYATLGIAINEAFISAFQLKYKYNFIRPITYIQQNIDSEFNTRITSPPFPEYPSGHSFQSGAATEVMKSIFGDSIQIIDITNQNRHDIDGSPRQYNSLTEMSEEISISRLYGGIHFQKTLDESLFHGRKIGVFITQQLKLIK